MTATRTYSTDNPFDASQWRAVEGFSDLTDITYHRHTGEGRANGIVRIAFDRPEVRNAFRPHTVDELYRVLDHARRTPLAPRGERSTGQGVLQSYLQK